MAIFKSSNFSPSLSEIDATDSNTFEAQINTSGEPAQAYKLTIMSGDASDTIYDGPIQKLSKAVKNKNILKIENVGSDMFTKIPVGVAYYSDTSLTTLVGYTTSSYLYSYTTGDTYASIIIGAITYYVDVPKYNGKTISNGKDYQWGVRTYNADPNSATQPNTLVCKGSLVGSTKYVTWVRIPNHADDKKGFAQSGVKYYQETTLKTEKGTLSANTAATLNSTLSYGTIKVSGTTYYVKGSDVTTYKSIAENIVYDRYIEYTAATSSDVVIGAHEPSDKVKPTTYPFIQRKKIDWVTSGLGTDKDFLKIETTEEFDYDYLDGASFSIYQCASDHTVNSLFADPNSNTNVSDFVIVYNTLSDAQAARTDGETPGDIKDTSRWAPCMERSDGTAGYAARKITGYSSDTGEMRFYDSFLIPPVNGQYYRLFEYDVVNKVYTAVDDAAPSVSTDPDVLESHIVGGTSITNDYFVNVNNNWTSNTKRLFIQPNINIKTDDTNPNEIVFDNGVRIDIIKQTTTNPDTGKTIDITFNKLDDSQWLLEGDSITLVGTTVPPIICQSDYKVYTDFMDSAPLNLIYAREKPTLTAYCKNYYYESNGKTFDVSEDYYIPNGTRYYHSYKDGKFIDWSQEEGYNQIYIPANTKVYTDSTLTTPASPSMLQSATTGTWIDDVCCSISISTSTDPLYVPSPKRVTTKNIGKSSIPTEAYVTITGPDGSTNTYYVDKKALKENPNKYMPLKSRTETQYYDYRDMSFYTTLTYGTSEIHPQIKYYKYSLYDSSSNLISESDDTYTIDMTWHFRGFESGESSTNSRAYTIKLDVIDEYNRTFSLNNGNGVTFGIYYTTESDIQPMNLEYNCHEHALNIKVIDVLYAESTEYEDESNTSYSSVNTGDFHYESDVVDYMQVPEGKVLNYTNVTKDEHIPIYIPSQSTVLSQFQLTGELIESIPNADYSYGPNGSYVRFASVGHQFTDTEMETELTALMKEYNVVGNNNINFSSLSSQPQLNPETPSKENPVPTIIDPYIRTITLGTSDNYVIVMNKITVEDGSTVRKTIDECDTYINTIMPDPTTAIIDDLITNDANTSSNGKKLLIKTFTGTDVSSATTYITNMRKILDNYKYLVDNNNCEEYTLVVTNINAYYFDENHQYKVNQDPGVFRVYRNNDFYNPVTCFDVNGTLVSDYSLKDNCGSKYVSNRQLKFALQSTYGYQIVETSLPLSNIDPNTKYVLVNDTSLYDAGIYQYVNNSYWEQNFDEDFIIVEDNSTLPGGIMPTGFLSNSISGTWDSANNKYIWKEKGTVESSGTSKEYDALYIVNEAANGNVNIDAFNDTWFIIYMVMDSINSTKSERLKCYVSFKEGGKQ